MSAHYRVSTLVWKKNTMGAIAHGVVFIEIGCSVERISVDWSLKYGNTNNVVIFTTKTTVVKINDFADPVVKFNY